MDRESKCRSLWGFYLFALGLLLCAQPGLGQVRLGDGLELSNLTGSLGAGYSGTYGNLPGSAGHGLDVNGTASLNGDYYNPGFLKFNVVPYYGESRANSDYRSVENSSGISANTTIFGGSHFPGNLMYGKAWDTSGQFSVPGESNITTRANTTNYGAGWSENVPGLPSLSVMYGRSENDYSIYGATGNGTSRSWNFSANSNYKFWGFRVSGGFSHGSTSSDMPAFLQEASSTTASSNDNYSLMVGHRLPLHGNLMTSFTHSVYSSSSTGMSESGGMDTFVANASVFPTTHTNLLMAANYSDNLASQINETLIASGVPTNELLTGKGGQALSVTGSSSYNFTHVSLAGMFGYREQIYNGETNSSSMLGGSASIFQVLWHGYMNGSVSVTENFNGPVNGQASSDTMGLQAVMNYNRRYGRWRTNLSFAYAQNQQTLLITYLTSNFNLNAQASRKLTRRTYVAVYGGGSHSGFVQQVGSGNSSESFGGSYGSRWISGSAGYNRSNGTSILTATGLSTTIIPILGSSIAYGSHGYSFSAASAPIPKLTLSFAYSVADSNTTASSSASASLNQTKSIYGQFYYRLRRITINGGYSRMIQGFSSSGTQATDISTFYIGISRWFNFF